MADRPGGKAPMVGEMQGGSVAVLARLECWCLRVAPNSGTFGPKVEFCKLEKYLKCSNQVTKISTLVSFGVAWALVWVPS